MYLALRDIRFARGRFALVVGVVALVMLLTGFLAGLAGGLAKQNVSAVLETDADRVVFGMPAGERPSFGDSRLTAPQLDAWAARPGVEEAVPIGVGRGALGLPGQQERLVPVALFGAPAGWRGTVPAEGEGIALAEATAQRLGVGVGDEVELAGSPFRVAAVTPGQMYAHQEAAWLPDGDYREAMASMRQQAPEATVLLVSGSEVDWTAADAEAGTVSQPLLPALLAIESFRSEIGSLGLMIGMLFLIGALVVGVFFLVWSLQRQRDLAVLKALGASDRMLRADAFG
ncbi:MAG: ABC transporter permease, partial [Pseudoclavibacter sp.]|nr:ABC transporter permease [Pseudoclavibacter sp.]